MRNPVLAFDRGAMREIIDEAVTGFVVQSVVEATAVLDRVHALDRARVRSGSKSASRLAAWQLTTSISTNSYWTVLVF